MAFNNLCGLDAYINVASKKDDKTRQECEKFNDIVRNHMTWTRLDDVTTVGNYRRTQPAKHSTDDGYTLAASLCKVDLDVAGVDKYLGQGDRYLFLNKYEGTGKHSLKINGPINTIILNDQDKINPDGSITFYTCVHRQNQNPKDMHPVEYKKFESDNFKEIFDPRHGVILSKFQGENFSDYASEIVSTFTGHLNNYNVWKESGVYISIRNTEYTDYLVSQVLNRYQSNTKAELVDFYKNIEFGKANIPSRYILKKTRNLNVENNMESLTSGFGGFEIKDNGEDRCTLSKENLASVRQDLINFLGKGGEDMTYNGGTTNAEWQKLMGQAKGDVTINETAETLSEEDRLGQIVDRLLSRGMETSEQSVESSSQPCETQIEDVKNEQNSNLNENEQDDTPEQMGEMAELLKNMKNGTLNENEVEVMNSFE